MNMAERSSLNRRDLFQNLQSSGNKIVQNCMARQFWCRDTILNSRMVGQIILVAKILVRIRIDVRLQSIF